MPDAVYVDPPVVKMAAMLKIISARLQRIKTMRFLLVTVMAVCFAGSVLAAGNAPQLTRIEQYSLHHANEALEKKTAGPVPANICLMRCRNKKARPITLSTLFWATVLPWQKNMTKP